MTRRLLNLLAPLSLMMCVAVVGLWARSYSHLDRYTRLDRTTGRLYDAVVINGGFQLARADHVYNRNGKWSWDWQSGWQSTPRESFERRGVGWPGREWQIFRGAFASADREVLGFRWLAGQLAAGVPVWSVRIPLWFPAVLFAAPGAGWLFARTRRARRRRRGLCQRCGYDLRATPGRCPECGHTPGAGRSSVATLHHEQPHEPPAGTS